VLVTGQSQEPSLADTSPALTKRGATFVTLRRDLHLLGCIGSIEAVRPLIVDAADNATGAAFRDPRLPPLSRDDFAVMELKVSVLSALAPIDVRGLGELVATVEPGEDGLLVTAPGHRGTFLPSVWEQLPRPEAFLEALWDKAGLGRGAWPPGLRVERYRTLEFGRTGPRSLPG
jgi:AmmeMemoRadiSam system protein A